MHVICVPELKQMETKPIISKQELFLKQQKRGERAVRVF